MKYVFLIAITLSMTACGFEQVDEGYRGIYTSWGKVIGEPLPPGLHFYNPISSSIFEMDVREHKWEFKEQSFTRDNQNITVDVAITAFPKSDKIGDIYAQFGHRWQDTVIAPALKSVLKDAVGKYSADDIVAKRHEAQAEALQRMQAELANRNVNVTRVDFVNLDFNDEYEKAVEEKVRAIQRALEAKNKTVQVEEEAKQKVATAEAEATAMRIKSNALAQNRSLVAYEIALKWDGKLPQIVMGSGGSIPMLDLSKLKDNQ